MNLSTFMRMMTDFIDKIVDMCARRLEISCRGAKSTDMSEGE